MKKYILPIFVLGVLFSQCSPKSGDKMAEKNEQKPQSKDMSEAFRKKAPAPGPAPLVELGTYETFKLDNGLQVILVENHKLPKVSFQLTVDRGPIKENELSGLADIAGDLLSKGTKSRKKGDIDAEIDFIGADLATSSAGVYGSSLSKHSDKLLAVMSDVLLNPTFPKDEFDKTIKQTLTGIASQKDDPKWISDNVAGVLKYGKNHPYGEVTTEATVKNITVDKCTAYYNKYFKPNISYLVIVGDATKDQAEKWAKQYFGSWQQGEVVKETFNDPIFPRATEVDIANKDGAVQSLISITYPIKLPIGAQDAVKASVMNKILGGGGFSTRLFQNLRENKAYTYGAYSYLKEDPYVGSFSAEASVRNAVTDSAVQEFLKELNRMRTENVTADELKLTKDNMAGAFARSMENPQTIANFALNTYRYKLPVDYYANYLKRLDAVTIEDVRQVAEKYILPDNAYIVVVGNKDEISDKLKKFSKTGEVNEYDIYGNPVKSSAALPKDITPEKLITDYINTIGGMPNIMQIKDLSVVSKASVQGMELTFSKKVTATGKLLNLVEAQGMSIQKQIFDGSRGASFQMGNKEELTNQEIDDMRYEAKIFPEIYYLKSGYKFDIKGAENVNGSNAYKVQVTSPTGKKTIEYYDANSKLKVREVSVQEANGQSQTITTDLADYKAVNGVLIPHKITVTGAMPVPLELKVTEAKANSNIPDTTFKID